MSGGAKREAIMAAVTTLGVLVKAEPDDGLLIRYADLLQDMSPRALELAFGHLEKTWTIAALPSPGEIRETGSSLREAEYRQEEQARQAEERRQWKQDRATPEEDADFRGRLRELGQRLAMDGDMIEARQRYEKRRRAREFERQQLTEFYLQLLRRAREEGWGVSKVGEAVA